MLFYLYATALPALAQKRSEDDLMKWNQIIDQPMIPPGQGQLGQRDARAKGKSTAAIEMCIAGQCNSLWSFLKLSEDPAVRSYLIRDVGASHLPANTVIQQLKIGKDNGIRSALILMLGSYSEKQIHPRTRKSLVEYLLQLYEKDPDAGIHGSIDWLLRYGKQGHEMRKIDWQQEKNLRRIDSTMRSKRVDGRKWNVTMAGQTMVTVEGPVVFKMGSPGNEPGREKGDIEVLHPQKIPRSFEIATKEVTIGQFHEFLDANPAIKKNAQASGQRDPTRTGELIKRKNLNDDCPQVQITWFEAAQYCNWLSMREGIPREEWCYPSTMEEIREGMILPTGYLDRTGYRLPTEAEWEYACRAGSNTMRHFGESEELLREYAWYTGNSFNERPWPVGQLKPNDWGLFDMHGSVWEWGQDLVKNYSSASDTLWVDTEDSVLIVSKNYKRPRKGGSYTYGADFMRAALRNDGYIPDERRDSVGFRLARTVRRK